MARLPHQDVTWLYVGRSVVLSILAWLAWRDPSLLPWVIGLSTWVLALHALVLLRRAA